MNDLDSIVKEFLLESFESLDQLDRDLVTLEKDPHNQDTLASIFRTIHTIKGTCGFFNFSKLGIVSHNGENLLSRLRDRQMVINPQITSALLEMVDAIREMLAHIEATGTEGSEEYASLIETLTRLQKGAPVPSAQSPVSLPIEPPAGPRMRSSLSEGNIRVDIGLLDRLMNLAGELVLTRNQILQLTAVQGDTGLLNASQRLNLITSELQERVMKTRMQPIGNTWNRFPRLVRDLALACGKQVLIEMDGKETELDKTVVEAIKDPLIHLVRNAIGHGIETPEVRHKRGKPREGRLQLRAYHESGQVNIMVSDDGGGIDVERIKRRALERNLTTREQAERMSERELLHLIFLPGFSTADEITDVSGRGVGMDVVRTNIEKIGGTLEIQSQSGLGTTIKIRIPLTLAIIPALIVKSGPDRYVIPQISLLKLIRLESEEARRGIEKVHGAPVYRLRGSLLPLVYLHGELCIDSQSRDAGHEAVNIVVLQANDRQFGLIVDEIHDTEEIVVKPLGKSLKSIPLFAGATILGDGHVALILDVLGIAQSSGIISESCQRSLTVNARRPGQQPDSQQAMLLLELDDERRVGVPLSLVSRLEEFPPEAIERAVLQEVVQYRGQILPLVRPERLFANSSPRVAATGRLQVVICTDQGQTIGLIVRRVLDIIATDLDVRHGAQLPGILGSAVIQERVTNLLDVPQIIAATDARVFQPSLAV